MKERIVYRDFEPKSLSVTKWTFGPLAVVALAPAAVVALVGILLVGALVLAIGAVILAAAIVAAVVGALGLLAAMPIGLLLTPVVAISAWRMKQRIELQELEWAQAKRQQDER